MRDSEQEYPRHQQRRRAPFDAEGQDEGELEAARPRRRGGWRQRDVATSPELPRNRLQKALTIGVIAGVLAAAQGILLVVLNAAVYNQAKGYVKGSQVPVGLATTIFGLLCLSLFIGAVIYFVAGLFTGRIAVERRMGFVAGFVAGVLVGIIGDLAQQLPSYPNAGTSGFSGNIGAMTGGILFAVVFLIVQGLVAGLIGLLGAWLATRHHAYYVGYNG